MVVPHSSRSSKGSPGEPLTNGHAPAGDELHPHPGPGVGAGGKRLKIINREALRAAVGDAAARAVERFGDLLSPANRRALAQGVSLEVLASIGSHGRRVRGMTRSQFLLKLDRARDETLLARDQARGELHELHVQLAHSRDFLDGKSVEHAMPPMELDAFGRELREVLGDLRGGGFGPGELEARLEERMQSVARAEIERICQERTAHYRREVDLFERRIQKLKATLAETERALAEIARLKDIDLGIPSLYRTVQGLGPAESSAERKAEMLSRIFEANLELQVG